MRLAEYQRAVMRVSFDLEPSASDLALLGDEQRFRMYREMIRGRLEDMAQIAFKLALAEVGEAAFRASFARFLAAGGVRSPYIREVVAAFGVFAAEDRALLDAAPDTARDLFLFEHAKWEVAYVPAQVPRIGDDGLRELDFEGYPVLNPVLRVLSLSGALRERCEVPTAPLSGDGRFVLLVYRPHQGNDVRWWGVSPFFARLLAHFQSGERTVADAVRGAADQERRAVDESLLEELATDLTLAVQRGVVLGVRG